MREWLFAMSDQVFWAVVIMGLLIILYHLIRKKS